MKFPLLEAEVEEDGRAATGAREDQCQRPRCLWDVYGMSMGCLWDVYGMMDVYSDEGNYNQHHIGP